MLRYSFYILFFVSLVLGGFSSFPVHAQTSSIGSDIQLLTEPQYPSPHSAVEVFLEAYSMNTTGATIEWFIDGTEQTGNENARNLTLTTGKLGDKQTVMAKITPLQGVPFSVTKVIKPSQVDVVLEADTYTPAFYEGRALPSNRSKIRAVAVSHTSPYLPLHSLTYEWRLGDTVLFGGPLRGRFAAELELPQYGEEYLNVRVTDASGQEVGGKTLLVSPSNTELHFYEENPLRGLSTKAIRGSLLLLGDETTIHAEPYFMNSDLSSKNVSFDWLVNGMTATQDKSHTLTLRRTGGSGEADVKVNVLTNALIPQYAQGTFSISF